MSIRSFRALGRRILAVVAVLGVVSGAVVVGQLPSVSAPTTGPIMLHTPVTSTYYGQAVSISGSASCAAADCVVTLFYRETPTSGELPPNLAGGGWSTVVATAAPGALGPDGRYSSPFAAEIPAGLVTTAGVDYFLEAVEPGGRTALPGTTTNVASTAASNSFFHIHTLNQPLLTHVGPTYVQVDQPVDLELRASCSTGNCTATLYWRTTDSSVLDEPLLETPPDWPNQQMTQTAATPLAPMGTALTFHGTIPASYVDTRGVDYFFHVTDGTTDAWWPGTTYQGYYAPTNGMRTGWHHIHAVEPPHMIHAPVTTAPYRQPISIEAQANCPSTRSCEATLYYRTTLRTVLDPVEDFATTPMTASVLTSHDGNDVINVVGTIPASVVDTRGVDYFFSIYDGSTTSWWPGTTHIDGYVPVEGTRVGYHHTRVLEPPHVTHVPPTATPALQPFTVEAQINCVTATCSATLWWADRLGVNDLEGLQYSEIPMQPTGVAVDTPVGVQQTWSATIPAENVTTTGLAYWIEASDGYTSGYAPGTFYWGAYLPVDGQRFGDLRELAIGGDVNAGGGASSGSASVGVSGPAGSNAGLAYPVRVLEPPHPVHAPPVNVERRRELALTMTTNCATPACSATFTYAAPGDRPRTIELVGRDVVPATSPVGRLVEYATTLQRSDVEPGLSYSFSVDDGFVTTTTPTYTPTLSDAASGGIVGGLLWRDIDGDGTRDSNEPPLRNARVTVHHVGLDGVAGTIDDLPAQEQRTDSRGMFEFHGLVPGTYQLTVDRTTLPPGITVSSGSDPRLVTLGANEQRRDLDVGFRYRAEVTGLVWSDVDADGVRDTGEPGLGGLDVVVSFDGPDSIPGTADDEASWRILTAADGTYRAVDLRPGSYTVTVAAPGGMASGSVQERALTLGATTVATGADFGLVAAPALHPATASPGQVRAVGPDGSAVVIDSNGGINPWDIRILRAPGEATTVRSVLASPAFDFSVPDSAPAFNSATITLQYDETRLDGFPEADIRIHHFNEAAGLWELAAENQIVDTIANTVTAEVAHFSVYAALRLDAEGWARYWASNPLRCLAPDAPTDPERVTLELSLVIDDSGSMGSSDANDARLTESTQLIDHLRALGDYDWVEVVSFTTIARRRAPFTRLLFPDEIKTAINAIADSDSGGTDIGAGVRMALTDFENHAWAAPGGIARAMVLLSDGAGSYDPDLTDEAIRQGVVIHTVSLGSSNQLMEDIARDTGGEHFTAPAAADLADVFADLAPMIRDDGDDFDGDGLSDCVERNGMLSSWGFHDGSPQAEYNTFYGDRIVTSEWDNPDTDDDGLSDGEEMLGLNLDDPRDLRDYPTVRDEYAFLINAGITRYYLMYSDPRVDDSDFDTLIDEDELRGQVESIDGSTYTTRADRPDTDLDGASDWFETQVLGTHPRYNEGNEFEVDGLRRFTIFQPDEYFGEISGPAVTSRYIADENGDLQYIEYNPYPVYYDDGFNCTRNCEEVEAEAASREGGDWCWTPWDSCSSEADRERDIVRLAVETQRVWNRDGSFREDFVATQGVAECLRSHDTTADCDPSELADAADNDTRPDDESYDANVAEVLMQIAGGYRPRDICGGPTAAGGVYRLIDGGGVTRYVGQTNNFIRRTREHLNDPRFAGLELVPTFRTLNYQVRRGLEQYLFNQTWGDVSIGTAQASGSLNGQRPMRPQNPAYNWRANLAERHVQEC